MKPFLSLATTFSLAITVSAVAVSAPSGKKGRATTAKAQPATQVDPAATALLDRVIAAYKAPNGIRLEFESVPQGMANNTTTGTIQWKPPSGLAIEKHNGDNVSLFLADGQDAYLFNGGTSYQRIPFAAKKMPSGSVAAMATVASSGLSQFMPAILAGQNTLRMSQKSKVPLPGFRFYARRVPLMQVAGESCNGLRQTMYFTQNKRKFRVETTGWFNAQSNFLRRTQQVVEAGGRRVVIVDRILETDLKPTFAPDTFVWTAPPGTREAAEDARELQQAGAAQGVGAAQGATGAASAPQAADVYWDPQLVPGAAPHALVGKDLKGNAVSLDNYRGKVVLLDFWATWCGPCVAEVPNVVRTYRKYHTSGFEIIGVSLDTNKNALTNFIMANKMPWPQIYDGKQFEAANAVRYKVQGIPFMLLIGKDGKIAAVNPVGERLEPAVKAALTR